MNIIFIRCSSPGYLPEAKKKIKQELDAHSTHLADFEKIKRFTLLPTTFSVEAGELTPTLKIKRHQIRAVYQDRLDRLY